MLSAFHGLCMALADSVPGVSGGTIAFILGFYDDLLRALHGLFGRDRSVRQQSLRALLRFGAGWAAGMIACILVLAELFELHIYFMCSLFLGLSAAAFPLVLRAERSALRNAARCAPLALLGAALTVGLTLLRADTAVSLRVEFSQIRVWPLLYLFISGAAAVSAMILPGISGSALLLIAGVYLPAMHALRQLLRLDFSGLPGILTLCLGAVAGAVGMLAAPDGSALGMEGLLPYFQVLPLAEYLYQDFVFPGIALLCVNGIPNLIAAALLFRHKKAGIILGGIFGLTLMAWITIQFVIFPANFMSTTYFIFGFLQAAAGLAAWIFYKQERFLAQTDFLPHAGTDHSRLVVYFSRMGYTKKAALEEARRAPPNAPKERSASGGAGGSACIGGICPLRRFASTFPPTAM